MKRKTGDLYKDTEHVKVTVEKNTQNGKTYYVAQDQYGNKSGNCRDASDAELELRAWHDVSN